MAFYRCGQFGDSTPIFAAMVFGGTNNVVGTFWLENGEMKYQRSGTIDNILDDFRVEFAYTSSLHKAAAYSLHGGTYAWRQVITTSTTGTSGIVTVGAGELICGKTSGTDNFTCVFCKIS